MNAAESCKCPACSDNLVFSIAEGLLVCPHCNASYDIEGYDSARRNNGGSPQNAAPETKDWVCPDCGGTVSAAVRACTESCPFCGAVITAPRPQGDALNPDLVIPFAKGREAFFQKFREYCVKHPFIPDDFSKSILPADIRGAYLPFFVYDAEVRGELSLHEYSQNQRNHHVGRHLVGDYSLNLKGFPEALASMPLRDPTGKDRPWNLCLEPWDLAEARAFSSSWCAGLRDKLGDTSGTEILKANKAPDYKGVKQRIVNLCVRLLTRWRCHDVDSNALAITPRSIRSALFPVWLIPVRYHDKTYLSVMNASTGKTALYVPQSSFKSYSAALGFGIFNAGLTMLSQGVLMFCWQEPRHALLAALGFLLYVPMLALVYLTCLKTYFFCSSHLFKGNISLFLTSMTALAAGLLMAYSLTVMFGAGKASMIPGFVAFAGFVAFVVFALSFGLILGGEKFIKALDDEGLFQTAKSFGVTRDPDRRDMDKNYIDLHTSSVDGQACYQDFSEPLPDPLEDFTPETYS